MDSILLRRYLLPSMFPGLGSLTAFLMFWTPQKLHLSSQLLRTVLLTFCQKFSMVTRVITYSTPWVKKKSPYQQSALPKQTSLINPTNNLLQKNGVKFSFFYFLLISFIDFRWTATANYFPMNPTSITWQFGCYFHQPKEFIQHLDWLIPS